MPGFTLIHQHNGLDKGITERAEKLVESSFKIQFISKTEKMLLLFREGNHYPYDIIETKENIIVVEGKVYSVDVKKDKAFISKCESIAKLKSSEISENDMTYFHELDGEFVIYIIDRKGDRFLVINDFFGRLPQYIYQRKQFIISRDIYVLDKVTTGLLFDESSAYQFLRMGFSLGSRSLFQDIERLGYSSIVNIENDEINIRQFRLNLEELEGTKSGKNALDELYDCFGQALKDRISEEERTVVSLSGGLDSRLVMGEIEKTGMTADYASFLYDNPIINNDVEIAKTLGKLYEKSPQLIQLKEWSPESFDELILAKGGMNYLGMAFITRFLIGLGHNYTLMLTGDGGDKTLPYLFPDKSVSAKSFPKYVLKRNAFTSSKSVRRFFINDAKDHEKELHNFLNEISGSNSNFKYKNFLIFERAFHWLFEGEDRNRNYLWSTTPFYQPQFFKLVHSIPEKEKINYQLMRAFGELVDARLNEVNNANWMIPLAEKGSVDRMMLKQRIKARLPIRKSSISQLETHSEMAILAANLIQKGYGGLAGIYADEYDLRATSSEMIFHLITLLKVSEMSWRGV